MEICLSSSPPRVSPRDSLPPSWLFRSLAGVRGGDGNLLEVLALGTRYMGRIHGWRAERGFWILQEPPSGPGGDHHFGSGRPVNTRIGW